MLGRDSRWNECITLETTVASLFFLVWFGLDFLFWFGLVPFQYHVFSYVFCYIFSVDQLYLSGIYSFHCERHWVMRERECLGFGMFGCGFGLDCINWGSPHSPNTRARIKFRRFRVGHAFASS